MRPYFASATLRHLSLPLSQRSFTTPLYIANSEWAPTKTGVKMPVSIYTRDNDSDTDTDTDADSDSDSDGDDGPLRMGR